MNIFEKFLYLLQVKMVEPKPFEWFHLMCLAILFVIITILYKTRNKHSEKRLKIVIGVYGIIAFILELLKQLMWSFNYDNMTNIVNWDYEWYAAPFQLCTTPIFVCVICLFLKKGKIRDSLFSYMSFVTILGSITTMIMPESCFVEDILVNIHTMWLHLGSFAVSIYLLISGEVEINLESLKRAILVFITFVALAITLNIVIYNSGILNGETFNMFYISPYFISTLPVFDVIQQSVPYVIYLLIYVVSLSLGAGIIYYISSVISKIKKKNKIYK